jgi:hypothetical protein
MWSLPEALYKLDKISSNQNELKTDPFTIKYEGLLSHGPGFADQMVVAVVG